MAIRNRTLLTVEQLEDRLTPATVGGNLGAGGCVEHGAGACEDKEAPVSVEFRIPPTGQTVEVLSTPANTVIPPQPAFGGLLTAVDPPGAH